MKWPRCWMLWTLAMPLQPLRSAITSILAAETLQCSAYCLGTGIRISELVGLNVGHIDFSTDSFLITRKGGAQVVLYFGEEVERALTAYLEDRKRLLPPDSDEEALFISLQKRRMSQRAIQQLVKKYAAIVTPLKKISPHKFRSTFGTMLNHETGDMLPGGRCPGQ